MKWINNAHRGAVVKQPTPKRGVVDVQKTPAMIWTHTIEGHTSCNSTVIIWSLSPHNRVHFCFPASKLVLRRDFHRASLHTDLVILKTCRHGPRKLIQHEAADPACVFGSLSSSETREADPLAGRSRAMAISGIWVLLTSRPVYNELKWETLSKNVWKMVHHRLGKDSECGTKWQKMYVACSSMSNK